MRGPTRTRARGMGGNRSHYSHPGAVVVERLGELLRVGCQQLLRVGNSLELHSGVGQRGREERRGEAMGRASATGGEVRGGKRQSQQRARLKCATRPCRAQRRCCRSPAARSPSRTLQLAASAAAARRQRACLGGQPALSLCEVLIPSLSLFPQVWLPAFSNQLFFLVSSPHLAATRPQAGWATGHRAASDVCRRAAPAGPGAHPLLICVRCRAGTAGHAGPALTSTPRTRCTQSQPTSGCILVVGGHTYDYEEGGAWGE